MYAFAARDPINFWDPFGLMSKSQAPAPQSAMEQATELGMGMGEEIFDRSLPGQVMGLVDQAEQIKKTFDENRPSAGGFSGRRALEGLNNEFNPLEKIDKLGNVDPNDRRALGRAIIGLIFLASEYAAAPAGVRGLARGRGRGKEKGHGTKKGNNPCPENSFEGSTPVLMCDGSLVAIEQLEAGDRVWTRDVVTGLESCEQVTQTFMHEDGDMMALVLEDERTGKQERLLTTHDHPMIMPDGLEVPVYQLETGQMLGGHLNELRVVSIQRLDLVVPAFNLSVDFARSFFVGELAAWAHNCYDELKDMLENPKHIKPGKKPMSKEEFERLSDKWGNFSGKHMSGEKHVQLRRKAMNKFGGDLSKMLRKSGSFNKKGAHTDGVREDGSQLWRRKDGEYLTERNGKIVDYGLK